MFQTDELLVALLRADIRFVVIGGIAVGVHGYIRATKDLDIVPDPEPGNLARLARLLGELNAEHVGVGDFSPDEFPLDPLDSEQLAQGANFRLYGKPAPNESVQLTVDPSNESLALTTAPKVAICESTGRLWPTSTMSDTVNSPLTVPTGADGIDHFTLAVGTVPGRWSLEAWGKNEDGDLSSDAANASDTKTLDVEALKPTTSLAEFVTEVKALKSQVTFSSADPSSLASMLAGIAAGGHTTGAQLGGLAFNVANSNARHGAACVGRPRLTASRLRCDGS